MITLALEFVLCNPPKNWTVQLRISLSISKYVVIVVQVRSQLRLFKGALLQLLHRDPAQRPSMQDFCRTCAHVLGDGGTTTTTAPIPTQNPVT